jgi:hypothetical protein
MGDSLWEQFFCAISDMYDARKNHIVNSSTIKDSNLEFPQKISICPERSGGSVAWLYFDLLSATNTRIEKGCRCKFISSIKYLDYLGFDCLDISIHTKSLCFPAAIEFAVGWTQEFKSYSDILLMLDDKEIFSSYVASGIYNSSNGSIYLFTFFSSQNHSALDFEYDID